MATEHSARDLSLQQALTDSAERTDAYLKVYLNGFAQIPGKLRESMGYSLFGPGKRIRPALAIFCCQAVGGTLDAALPAGAAVELIHCFSLVHDDLPAMDDDDLRRGRPTNHKVFGDAMAILAGDGLNTLAFELLADKMAEPRLALRLVKELAWATGGEGMIGGQVLDTCHPEEARSSKQAGGTGEAKATLADLQRIHRMKTGALINAACRMGAIAADASAEKLALIDTYGKAIGLAFQIVDDLLDVTATAEQLGKNTGKDAQIGKLTYPGLIGMEESKKHLAEQVAITDRVTGQLGADARLLRELSHFMATRTK